ncbi:TlpA disulfide reductase family protein [Arthrobacter sp. H5]|uniref:TlpA family protein disulfide reductase n=1 Tax=Arthrobacter sp. H5 TaxID=1267973 RepID=UPI0004BA258F|nr:TlpA disulfide reductase family protein [Arthrobacter sp. H5]
MQPHAKGRNLPARINQSQTSPRRVRRTARAVGVIALASVVFLAGCAAPDSLAQQASAGDNKNYIAGDGSVSEFAASDRGEPIPLEASLMDGSTVSTADLQGQVTVLNFWYAACAPCRAEAPDLEALYQEFSGKGVQFYGVNIRDEAPTATSFERNFGISYPSMLDTDGRILLALSTQVPPQAVPTTLILDKQGRISARILGIAEKSTLKALIESASNES